MTELCYSWQPTLNGLGHMTENYQNWPCRAIWSDYLMDEFKEADYPVQNSLKIVWEFWEVIKVQMITKIRRIDEKVKMKKKSTPGLSLKNENNK